MLTIVSSRDYLSISGRNLTYKGEKVFLSGMNQAWWSYSNDFGNNGYANSKPHLMATLDAVRASGGNSIREFFSVLCHTQFVQGFH